MILPRSHIAEITFPSLPSPEAAGLLAVLYQLEQTQWWQPEEIQKYQLQQLQGILQHAYQTIPFYRNRFEALGLNPSKEVNLGQWHQIPILGREEVQQQGDELLSQSIPARHKPLGKVTTSGSTGTPLQCYTTAITRFLWNVYTIRDHLWHKRDFRKKLGAIRYAKQGTVTYPEGIVANSWGEPNDVIYSTGQGVLLNIQTKTSEQLEWLGRQQPNYLITYPSNVLELAKLALSNNIQLPALEEIRLFGEIVEPEVRQLCQQAWNVKVTDIYSANEVGYIALQCPECDSYHIQSENLFVEILNDKGKPCQPGEIGRVVMTTLHNFANPLIRYQIGDYAEVGEPCSCGRGLPVLKRILGRARNMLVLPTGEKSWPVLGGWHDRQFAPIKQRQFVQKSLEEVELRLVVERPLTQEEEEKITQRMIDRLGYPFRITLTYFDKLERSKGGKFEEFICQVT